MTMPMSLSSSQTAAATGTSNSGFDNSGFVVNFGGANSVGGALPQWLVWAAIGGAAWWLLKRR